MKPLGCLNTCLEQAAFLLCLDVQHERDRDVLRQCGA